MTLRFLLLALLAGLTAACASTRDLSVTVDDVVGEVRAEVAPDKRVVLLEVSSAVLGQHVTLSGETTSGDASRQLEARLVSRGFSVDNRIIVLPGDDLGEQRWAVVNNSVANIRSAPLHSAELATQALLGTVLNVFKKEGGFYLVQTPDGYLGWVDGLGIHRIDDGELTRFVEAASIVYREIAGFAVKDPDDDAPVVADLVLGSRIELLDEGNNFYHIRFPDGRTGYVSIDEASPYESWLESVEPTPDGLVATAGELMGVPYMWGGTSPKAVDCSGYTKTIYFEHGLILPRDASQQVHSGTFVDDAREFSNVQKGDLLFFGEAATDSARERVVHVGMWIGNNEFIHSSGRVRVSSVDPDAPNFDEYNLSRYLRTKRILGSDIGVWSVKEGGLLRHVKDARGV